MFTHCPPYLRLWSLETRSCCLKPDISGKPSCCLVGEARVNPRELRCSSIIWLKFFSTFHSRKVKLISIALVFLCQKVFLDLIKRTVCNHYLVGSGRLISLLDSCLQLWMCIERATCKIEFSVSSPQLHINHNRKPLSVLAKIVENF